MPAEKIFYHGICILKLNSYAYPMLEFTRCYDYLVFNFKIIVNNKIFIHLKIAKFNRGFKRFYDEIAYLSLSYHFLIPEQANGWAGFEPAPKISRTF